jgi:predicted RNase H-like HicB family nuclease
MKQVRHFTAVIEREGDGYVALSPELDIASQGDTGEEARQNLLEAIELFLEAADSSEIQSKAQSVYSEIEGRSLAGAIQQGWQGTFVSEDKISAILESYRQQVKKARGFEL